MHHILWVLQFTLGQSVIQVQVQVYFTTNYRSQQFTLNYQIQFRTDFQIAVLRYDPNINMKNEILISG